MTKENNLWCILSFVLILIILNGCQSQMEDKNPLTNLPPLTETQKLEAAKAPEGMAYIPEGEYLSGIPSSNEKPLTTISLKSFYIDRLEVMNEQYVEFMNMHPEWQRGSVSNELQDGHYLAAFDGKTLPPGLEKYPVSWVSWFAAKAFCESHEKRLPTAAEWEKAARGTDGRDYPWGDTLDNRNANYCDRRCSAWFREKEWDDGFAESAPVGSFKGGASPYGAFDMAGNVAEWAADWGTTTDKNVAQGTRDPRGPENGVFKVVLGRSWGAARFIGLELYRRDLKIPVTASGQIGFRCAADVK